MTIKNIITLIGILSITLWLQACGDTENGTIDGDLDASEDEVEFSDGDFDVSEEEVEPSDGDLENEQEISETDLEQEVEAEEEIAERPEYPMDDIIRINQIQVKGTHNSYHVATDVTPLPQLEYTHKPLDVQLEEQGVRQFEIDVTWSEEKGFIVIHDELFDPGTTCEYFTECMQLMKNWSVKHPGHHILFFLIEPKDDNAEVKFDNQQLEAEMLEVWGREHILTPDDLRGEAATLKEAILTNGWPTLGETRDKVMFILFDSGEHKTSQLEDHPNLEDRVMFVRSSAPNLESDWAETADDTAVYFTLDHPVEDADKIKKAVESGFLVRTRADANVYEPRNEDYSRQEQALKGGAQLISTDFPEKTENFDYMFTIEDGNPSRCNPLNAPSGCTSEAIENLP